MTCLAPRRAVGALAALGCAAGVLGACSSAGAPGSTTDRLDGGSSAGRSATVTISAAHGCQLDRTRFAAGGITFTITNQDATAVSEVELLDGERILGEKENVAAGLGGRFSVHIGAGRYTVYCPGAATERTPITVTGTAAKGDDTLAALLRTGTTAYRNYVDTQIGYLVTATGRLAAALHGGGLGTARTAYIAARPFYEKIEPVAESFVSGMQNLDADIDARADDVPAARWSGFHRIEQALFQRDTLAGTARWGDRLAADVRTLQQKASGLSYQAPDLANGAQELLDEVAATKITGEEERYSHIDLVDMANNVEGAEQAFAQLQPALTKIDPTLPATIAGRFRSLDGAIAAYRSADDPSGYLRYPALGDADRRRLAAAVKAVQEPLSRVGAKVANP
jgi:iron uptake system component EfeO